LIVAKAAKEKKSHYNPLRIPTVVPTDNAELVFTQSVQGIADQYGVNTDASRADWAAAKHMMLRGYTYEQIARAMLNNDSIQARKRGHVNHYVQTMTLNKLFSKCHVDLLHLTY